MISFSLRSTSSIHIEVPHVYLSSDLTLGFDLFLRSKAFIIWPFWLMLNLHHIKSFTSTHSVLLHKVLESLAVMLLENH